MFGYMDSIIAYWGDSQEKVKLPSKASSWTQARFKARISFSRKYNTGAVGRNTVHVISRHNSMQPSFFTSNVILVEQSPYIRVYRENNQ